MDDHREKMRQGLLDSYKHRLEPNAHCALCGNTTHPLAFHILEGSLNEGIQFPKGFFPMSVSNGRIRGSFPICDCCAPPCKKCKLPIPREKVLEFGYRTGAQKGIGICYDINIRVFATAIFKRFFKLGRFENR